MPTGSGKTAVLAAAAFVLRAKRVLVIAPNRLVREQLTEQLGALTTLRRIGAVANDVPNPRVASVKKRIVEVATWEGLREYDVVVGMTQSISSAFEEVPDAPADLFDLVLVDEAHHSPARTWQTTLDGFPTARRVLFTATPYRQDQREIKGRFIYTYDLKRAFDDGVFGRIVFEPVLPRPGEGSDAAIARHAEAKYRSDQAAGYQHRLMVRTDSKPRALALEEVYRNNTALRLRVISGDKSLRYLNEVIGGLRAGMLDGVICVNMMGEGFDFPSLKIAAIHSPHRSLNVTLQFIGRFARTAGENLGPATFIAVPSEIEIEAERLYDTRAVWQVMVQNLSATRVTQEAQTREVLESFASIDVLSEDLSDLSLYVLEPYYHVKIYQLGADLDMRSTVAFPDSMQVVYEAVSEEHNAAVYITREFTLPKWSNDDRLASVQADLFIFHQDPTSKLLFICASRRSDGLYEELSSSFAGAHPRPLPLARLNRALNDLGSPEFFNVGMRNRVSSSTTESYRMITGSNADKAIQKSDGRLYHRGHVFGRANDGGDLVTIGLSSASKIWSNRSSKLPQLIDWCRKLADRISSDRTPVTGSGLDHLDVGEEITELPPGIFAAAWPPNVIRQYPEFRFSDEAGDVVGPVLDLDVLVDRTASTGDTVALTLSYGNRFRYRATFSFVTDRFFEAATLNEPNVAVEQDRGEVQLIEFLNANPLWLYTTDLGLVQTSNYFKPSDYDPPTLDRRQIEAVDWAAAGVEMRREVGPTGSARISVHEWLEARLAASDASVVYYDHGTGEIADFVAIIGREGGGLLIRLYHCKGAGGAAAGQRLDDLYEVSMQAVKSVTWALKQRILSSIKRRFNNRVGSHRFVKGDVALLEDVLREATPAQIAFEFIAVQPGLAKSGLSPELENILSATSDHLVRGGFLPLGVIASE